MCVYICIYVYRCVYIRGRYTYKADVYKDDVLLHIYTKTEIHKYTKTTRTKTNYIVSFLGLSIVSFLGLFCKRDA